MMLALDDPLAPIDHPVVVVRRRRVVEDEEIPHGGTIDGNAIITTATATMTELVRGVPICEIVI